MASGPDRSSDFKLLYSFGENSMTGKLPRGRLILDNSGHIYGVTNIGGRTDGAPSGHGVVFKLAYDRNSDEYTYSVIHHFRGGPDDGARPVGGLLLGTDGLYGTTAGGGSSGTGTVFKLIPGEHDSDPWTMALLHEFTPRINQTIGSDTLKVNHDGAEPSSHLIMNSAGTLFGTTSRGGSNGGGTVFTLTPDKVSIFTKIHDFDPISEYDRVIGGLIMDRDESLYGLNSTGGDYSGGRYLDYS